MNADHELDEAEVTEMTQMISALEQNGFTHDLATKVYQEIGKLCHDAIAEIHEVLETGDQQALYEIYGKALVKALVHQDDLGRVIGKKGRVASAIRTIAHAAAIRQKQSLEIEFDAKED